MRNSSAKKLRRLEQLVSEYALVPWTEFQPAIIPGQPEIEVYLNSRVFLYKGSLNNEKTKGV